MASAVLSFSPSPFNPTTSIRFTLPHSGRADLRIFDAAGAEIARPVEGALEAGAHATVFDGSGLASGIYLARLWLDGKALATEKVTLLK